MTKLLQLQQGQSAIRVATDLDTLPVIPVGKLDADNYTAEDIDGVTESLFGSGNMGYASLQASQTDAALMERGVGSSDNSAFNLEALDSSPALSNGNMLVTGNNAGVTSAKDAVLSQNPTDTDRPLEISPDTGNEAGLPADSKFGSSALGAAGAAGNIANNSGGGGGFSLSSIENEGDSLSVTNNSNPSPTPQPQAANGINGQRGQNGTNGLDGMDAADGYGDHTTIYQYNTTNNINNYNTTNQTTNNYYDNSIISFEENLIDIGDMLTLLSNTINNTTNVMSDVVQHLDVTNIIQVNQVVDVVNNITTMLVQNLHHSISGITDNVSNITNLLNQLFCEYGDGEGGGLHLSVDLDALGLTSLDLDVTLKQVLEGDLDIIANLGNATELLNVLDKLEGTEFVNDALDRLSDVAEILHETIIHAVETISQLLPDLQGLPVADAITGLFGDLTQLDEVAGAIAEGVDDLLDGTTPALEEIIPDIISLAEGFPETVMDVLAPLDEVLSNQQKLLEGLADNPAQLVETVTQLTDQILNPVVSLFPENGTGESLGDPLGLIEQVVDDVSNTLDHITHGATEPMTCLVQDVVANPLEGTGGLLGGLSGGDTAGQDQDMVLTPDIELLGQDILAGTFVDEGVNLLLNPTEDLAGDVDLGIGAGLDLLNPHGTDNANGDNDLVINTGIDLIDNQLLGQEIEVTLDPMEQITGDIDLDINLAGNVLGNTADSLLDNAAGGSATDNLLSGAGDQLADTVVGLLDTLDIQADAGNEVNLFVEAQEGEQTSANDTDLVIQTDIELASIDVSDIQLDIPLDPVENLLGDIDIDVGAAINLLGNSLGGSGDDSTDGDAGWTESGDVVSGLFGDILGDTTSGGGDTLPDPVGSVSEGLGILNIQPEIKIGKFGGLFG